jgi:hypothetical protein
MKVGCEIWIYLHEMVGLLTISINTKYNPLIYRTFFHGAPRHADGRSGPKRIRKA